MAPKRKASARTASKAQPPKSKISKVIKEEPEIEEKENNNEEFESDEDLCAYEKIRLQNIAMRQNKFDELNLSNLVSEASASAQKKIAARRGLAADGSSLLERPSSVPRHESRSSWVARREWHVWERMSSSGGLQG